MSLLKENSIQAHRLWDGLGRPHPGDALRIKQQAKYEYKLAYRSKERQNQEQFTDELNDALASKDMNSFWKSCRAKFSKKKVSPVIDGSSDSTVIAERFANLFKSACSPNCEARNVSLAEEFECNFASYDSVHSSEFVVDVELVSSCIDKLKRSKAAGLDGLTVEHLLFAHPVVVLLLTYLIQLIIKFEIVPTDFGFGLVIPLVKSNDSDVTSSNNYRDITLSPVISKVFELVLMEMVSDKLTSSPLQFGFKAKSSCSHAIFTLRMLVKHYCSSGSTLTLCALDISKAFDRVWHRALLAKLLRYVDFLNP